MAPTAHSSSAASAADSDLKPIVRELGVPPAVLRRLATRLPARYPVLLDSAAEGPLSRTSVLLAEPRAALWLDADGNLAAEGVGVQGNTFFAALENWWLAEREPAQTRPDPGGGACWSARSTAPL